MTSVRREELAANLTAVRRRIRAACDASGRPESDVALLAVSKTFPAADVAELLELGQYDMAESRHQEAVGKAHEVGRHDLVRWHFLGQLQRNKAAAVAAYATCVHSLDRLELVAPLARGAESHGRRVDVLVQINLDETMTGSRGGTDPEQSLPLAAAVAGEASLALCGVMGIAPRGGDPRSAFARLRLAAERIRAEHPGATVISAGMSGDLEAAIAEGSTLVRVGTALFGHRPPALG